MGVSRSLEETKARKQSSKPAAPFLKFFAKLWLKGGNSHFSRTFSHFYHVGLLTVCTRYTGTQVHRYTGTQVHRYTGTQVHRYTGTQVHRYTGTQVHRYTGTQVHRYTGTQVHRYTGTQVHRYTVFNFYKAGKTFLGADSHFFRPPFQPHQKHYAKVTYGG